MNIIELQERVVVEAMRAAVEGWNKIVINYEIKDVAGEIVQSNAFFCYFADKKDLVFDAPDVDEALKKLSLFMSDSGKVVSWQIADLEINSDGEYKFDFSYDEPPRITKMLKGEF